MEASSKDNPPLRRLGTEMVHDFLPQAKPFTKALMLRASQRGKAIPEEQKKPLKTISYPEKNTKFEDFVASSAVATSVGVAQLAAQGIGINPNFLPGSKIPKEASILVAFSLCILKIINQFVLGEGVKIDLKLAVIDTAKMHYMFHNNQEASERAFEGVTFFQEVQASNSKDIGAWREGMSKLVSMYVLQWTSEHLELKNLNCIPLFGKCLKMLIGFGFHGVVTTKEKEKLT
jgi:hypothetical protein